MAFCIRWMILCGKYGILWTGFYQNRTIKRRYAKECKYEGKARTHSFGGVYCCVDAGCHYMECVCGTGTEEKPLSSSLAISGSGGSLSEGKVNINTAGVEELCRLPGIGEVLAGRIIGYRQEYGPYTDPAQLKNIKGIGDKVYEKLVPMVTW